jgi:hypothetical protein
MLSIIPTELSLADRCGACLVIGGVCLYGSTKPTVSKRIDHTSVCASAAIAPAKTSPHNSPDLIPRNLRLIAFSPLTPAAIL